VLPIGGLKEKALAAQRNKIRTVIAPSLNELDVDEIPEHLRRDLEFVFVDDVGQVLETALAPVVSKNGRGQSPPRARRPARA
jgi:ATP-dependent Lon protease